MKAGDTVFTPYPWSASLDNPGPWVEAKVMEVSRKWLRVVVKGEGIVLREPRDVRTPEEHARMSLAQ